MAGSKRNATNAGLAGKSPGKRERSGNGLREGEEGRGDENKRGSAFGMGTEKCRGDSGSSRRSPLEFLDDSLILEILDFAFTIRQMCIIKRISRRIHRILAPRLFSTTGTRALARLNTKRCVRFLQLRNFSQVDFDCILSPLLSVHKLHRIDLHKCSAERDSVRTLIQGHNTHVKAVSISGITTVCAGLEYKNILGGCSRLRTLAIRPSAGSKCHMDYFVMRDVTVNCPKLLHLQLSGYVSGKSLQAIGEHLSHLRSLKLEAKECREYISNDDFIALGNLCMLRELRLIFPTGCFVIPEIFLRTLKRLRHLKKLEIPFLVHIQDHDFSRLSECCPLLELLDLFYCRELTTKGLLEMTRNLQHLRCLNVKRCGLGLPDMIDVLKHPSLRHVLLPHSYKFASLDYLLRFNRLGFSHEGNGRFFRHGVEQRFRPWFPTHPSSGKFMLCEVCMSDIIV